MQAQHEGALQQQQQQEAWQEPLTSPEACGSTADLRALYPTWRQCERRSAASTPCMQQHLHVTLCKLHQSVAA